MLPTTKSFSAGIVLLFALGSATGGAAEPAQKKLQIFILAGQSNMVGHANYITIPSMLTAEEPGVKELAKLVFKAGALAPGAARDQLETRIKRDELNEKLRAKKITDPEQIAAAGRTCAAVVTREEGCAKKCRC